MALNIKNSEVERLAAKLAKATGKSKTEVIRVALEHEEQRLNPGANRGERMRLYLEEHVWPNIPAELRGKPISKAEREEILGYGPDGGFH
jgi:antitoxin VapB